MYHATCVGVMAGLLNTTRDDEKTRHDEVAIYGIATLLLDVGMGCDESMRSLALERAFRACQSPGEHPPWTEPSPAQAELGMCLVARAVEAIFGPVEATAAKRGDELIRRYATRAM